MKRYEVRPLVDGEYRHLVTYMTHDRMYQGCRQIKEISRDILADSIRQLRQQARIHRKYAQK